MGAVKIWNAAIPELSGDALRRIYLYLPDGWNDDDERYPVMYMFDGHNVFFDSHATYGKSWGMLEYMERTQKKLIIVAVECNHEGISRLEEYAPFSFDTDQFGRSEGRGKVYMDWLVHTLKPYIDENYPTLPGRDHTMICGSSMGGLMALYAAVSYRQVFSRAACLSPSLWVDPVQAMNLNCSCADLSDTRIYMDYGSEELRAHENNEQVLKNTARTLRKNGAMIDLRIIPGGTHCEASWEKQIPAFMEYLGM